MVGTALGVGKCQLLSMKSAQPAWDFPIDPQTPMTKSTFAGNLGMSG